MVHRIKWGLYADSTFFYPTIYGPNRVVIESRIKTKQPIGNKYIVNKTVNIKKELIIKVGSIEGDHF